MLKFVGGYLIGRYVTINNDAIIKLLSEWIAKLQLRLDILKHDNPDL